MDHQPLGEIHQRGAAADGPATKPEPAPDSEKKPTPAADAARTDTPTPATTAATPRKSDGAGKLVPAGPATRRLARELGVAPAVSAAA